MRRIAILGGGVGGTMVANRLARELRSDIDRGDVEVVLIGEDANHIYQPGFLYVAFNQAPLERFVRPQTSLLVSGVRFLQMRALRIDADNNSLLFENGDLLTYDYLVIATGSHPTMDTVSGLKEGAYSFYTADQAIRLRKALANMTSGRIVIGVDVPHKCPVAVLEFTLMLDEYLRKRGTRDQFEIIYTYPIGRLHSLVPVANWVEPEFERRGIQSEFFFNVDNVDPDKRVIESLEGSSYAYDLLIMVPAHRGAKVIMDSGIGDESGFVPTDRYSLRMKGSHNVFVIGDATDLPISKAGSTAHYEADTIVANLIDELHGLPADHQYDGKVYCFIEGGLEKATYIAFSYTEPPKPTAPSELLHWFKLMYNEIYWLSVRGLL